jgi:hypothetical protein
MAKEIASVITGTNEFMNVNNIRKCDRMAIIAEITTHSVLQPVLSTRYPNIGENIVVTKKNRLKT